jgi:hypothetical protein
MKEKIAFLALVVLLGQCAIDASNAATDKQTALANCYTMTMSRHPGHSPDEFSATGVHMETEIQTCMKVAGYSFNMFRDTCQPKVDGEETWNPDCYVTTNGTTGEAIEQWWHGIEPRWKFTHSARCALYWTDDCLKQ